MVRFLHTADWQMGMRAVHAGVKAKAVRDIRFDSALQTVRLAKENQVELVIVAGDTFEHHDVDEVVVKRTVDILNQFSPITVYVLPGNHDPYVPGGVWDRQSWRRIQSHVVLCTQPEEIEFSGDVVLYPCPLKQKRSTLDPTSWIPQRSNQDTRVRIGIAHGALDLLPDTVNFPIPVDRPESSGLDYLALGDWHSRLEHGHAVYSGTMEPTSFTEHDPGNVVVVDIPSAGEKPNLEWHRTSSFTWSQFSPSIQDETDVETLDKSIKALGRLESLILRIEPIIAGEVSECIVHDLQVLKDELDERVFLLEWDTEPDSHLNLDTLISIPDGLLQQVDEALATILDGRIPEEPGHTFAGEDRATVQEARSLLYRLARGGS